MMTAKDVLGKIKNGEDALIVMVGDSITWGLSHCAAEETYCANFARLLGRQFPQATVVRYDGEAPDESKSLAGYGRAIPIQPGDEKQRLIVVRSGVGGNTVLRTLIRIDNFTGKVVEDREPDLITIMLGVNDALVSEPLKYVSDQIYKIHLQMLVREIQRRNPQTAIILMTPSYNDLGETDKSCLDPYSDRVKEVADEFGLLLIDIHQKWMDHFQMGSENYGQRDWLSGRKGDSTHLSPKGAEVMARHIIDGWMNH